MPVLAIIAAALAILAGGGGAYVAVRRMSEEKEIRFALRTRAILAHVDPDIAEAIGKTESEWKLRAINMTGGDLARGGAWGPTQITEKTARAYGYAGPMEAFREDPDLAAKWTAILLAKRPGGPPTNIRDAGAWWNAGKATADRLTPGGSTETKYLPRLMRAYDYVRSALA